jgi:sRNA-binding carbon storage regulator CsrA
MARLIVRRKHGEFVKIGPEIRVTVLTHRKGGEQYLGDVQLVIDAPPDVVILRGELEPRSAPRPQPTLGIVRGR